MADVKQFFEVYHPGKFMIYNLCSERRYDVSHFGGRVKEFGFDDHNAPPFHFIMAFCKDATEFLEADPDNIIAVHWYLPHSFQSFYTRF